MEHHTAQSYNFPARYAVERQLGEGAMGVVYLATDLEERRKVVIKALKAAAVSDPRKVARFHNEFNALKNCKHQNIIRVFDFSEFQGQHFYTMEYLEGRSLDQHIYDSTAQLTLDAKIEILFQIAQALLCVHEKGLIHRDLKPANVFITAGNTVKLLDFGIARLEEANFNLTNENETLGTPYYMSPEQNLGEALDVRSDIYSFGVLAFELCAGARPFSANSQFQLRIEHLAAEVPSLREVNSSLPSWLDSLVITCMQKDKARRYDSMQEILVVLLEQHSLLRTGEDLQKKLSSLGAIPLKHKINARQDLLQNTASSAKRLLTVCAMVTAFLIAWFSPVGYLSTAQLLRTMFYLRGEITAPERVVIVALDDLTYQKVGVSTRHAFPRKYWAAALEKIHATKPTLVVIDGYVQKETDDEAANAALEAAIAKGPTVLMKWEQENRSLPEEKRNEENALKYHNDPRFSRVALLEIEPFIPSHNGIVMGIGLQDKQYKTIDEQIPLRGALTKVGISNLGVPKTHDYINFYGKPNHITSISMHEVISGNFDFRDSIVFMGYKSLARTDAPGMYDVFPASGSFSEDYFGVEIHAVIAGNLLEHSFIKRLPEKLEHMFLTIVSGFIFLFLLSKKPSQAIIYFMVILSAWFSLTVWAFMSFRLLLPGVYLMFFCSFFVCAGIWYFYGNAKDADLTAAEELTKLKLRRRNE